MRQELQSKQKPDKGKGSLIGINYLEKHTVQPPSTVVQMAEIYRLAYPA